MDGLISMRTQATAALHLLILAFFGIVVGCKLGEGKISEHIPTGVRIPIDLVPTTVLPDAKRRALPDGTTVEHCEEDIYRFNYPDGQIRFRNAKGEDCGGII